MGPLGAYFRTGYSLSEREREIAVIITNSKWNSIYPTNAHERAGKAAGLPPDKVEALLSGLPASFEDTREQVVYELAMCPSQSPGVRRLMFFEGTPDESRRATAFCASECVAKIPTAVSMRRAPFPGKSKHGVCHRSARPGQSF